MRQGRISAFLLFVVLVLCPVMVLSASSVFDSSLSPSEDDNFFEASARLWIPEESSTINAIVIVLGGTDSDGRSAIEDRGWREFAKKKKLALLGCFFRGDGEPYEDAKGGSGKALVGMINDLAEKSGRFDLRDAPLIFVGHSAGAMFSYNFTCWKPDAVAAFVSIKSGPISTTENAQAFTVPGLFIVGEFDLSGRVQSTASAFLAPAVGKSRWAFALEPQGGHGSSPSIRALVFAYLSDVLSLQETSARAGKFERFGIARCLENPKREIGDPTELGAAWLPGTRSVRVWESFVQPSDLTEFARSGGKDDQSPARVFSPLEFGSIDISRNTDGFQKTFVVTLPPDAEGIFRSKDKRLEVIEPKPNAGRHQTVTLKLVPGGLSPGVFRSSIEFIAQDRETASFPVTARIITDYQAKPSSLYVGVIPRGSLTEMKVLLSSGTDTPLEVSSIRSSHPAFAQVVSGGDGVLLCRFDASKGLGNQSGYFEVMLSGIPKRQLRIPFIAWVSKKTIL